MKRTEIINEFRQQVDDTVQPYLWSDAEVASYLDSAHSEAAWRARLIRDTLTVEDANADPVCAIPVVNGTDSYYCHPSIFEIERAKLDSRPVKEKLKVTSKYQMDRQSPGWEAVTGVPRYLIVEHEGARIRVTLAPSLTFDDTLWLAVYRLPLESLNTPDDEPEIPARHHIQLVDYMVHLAYRKRDAETRDDAKSVEALQRFTMHFGPAREADVHRRQQERRQNVIRFKEF